MSLSRRHFLQRGGALATLTAAAPWLRRAAALGPGLPPGIQLYAVRDPLAADAPATFKALAQIGFREVETAGFGTYTARDFRRFADDVGIRIPSAHLPLHNAPDLPAQFADANALGARYATSSVLYDIFGPGRTLAQGPAHGMQTMAPIGLDGFKRMAAEMNRVGQQADAAGLRYAYHNHNFEFERMPDGRFGFDILLAETDPGQVKFEIDCGWMIIAGASPVEYFRRHPGRFRMLHVKDFKTRMVTTDLLGPDRPTGVELGHGFIDYKPIFRAAPAAGIEHAFAEQEAPYTQPQLASARVSFDYLKSLG